MYDIAFLGNYTKDTIVSASGTRLVDGGGFNYGAHVGVQMGLRVAAITRLARADWHVVTELERLGIDVLAEASGHSTCLRLEYPGSNPDERVITVASTAGSFTPQQVRAVEARAFVVSPTLLGEVGLDLLEALAAKNALVAVDAQGFVRTLSAGRLVHGSWPEKERALVHVNVLKADAVEATALTGTSDLSLAARTLAAVGPSEIVLTHRDGLVVHAGGRYFAAGFFPEKLVGRSGRGDTCLAAYVARRLDAPPAEATAWAAALTTLKLEAEGPFCRTVCDVQDLIARRYRS